MEQVIRGSLGHPPHELSTSVRFDRAEVAGCDFSGRQFFSFGALESLFRDCAFADSTFAYALLGQGRTTYERCSFREADLRGVDPGDATFIACDFTNARIAKWMSFCAEFIDCRFETRIVDCVFSASPRSCSSGRSRNRFHANDFSQAELLDVMFIGGVDLSDQRLPTSDDYVTIAPAAAKVAEAELAVAGWPEPEKKAASAALAYMASFAEDQDELFLRRTDLDLPPSTAARLWSLLTQ